MEKSGDATRREESPGDAQPHPEEYETLKRRAKMTGNERRRPERPRDIGDAQRRQVTLRHARRPGDAWRSPGAPGDAMRREESLTDARRRQETPGNVRRR